MAEIFGIDIAKEVADGLAAAGGVRPGTLSQNGSEHSFRGFTEVRAASSGDERVGDSLVYQGRRLVNIVGASLPAGVAPNVGDTATIDGVDYILGDLVSLDPAQALYTFAASE